MNWRQWSNQSSSLMSSGFVLIFVVFKLYRPYSRSSGFVPLMFRFCSGVFQVSKDYFWKVPVLFRNPHGVKKPSPISFGSVPVFLLLSMEVLFSGILKPYLKSSGFVLVFLQIVEAISGFIMVFLLSVEAISIKFRFCSGFVPVYSRWVKTIFEKLQFCSGILTVWKSHLL